MKQVFITGATGAIGSALVPFYLNEPETFVTLLLRPKRDRSVAERLRSLFEFWELTDSDPRWFRIQAIEGDAALPCFGIEPDRFKSLSRTVTHIVHCAGAVKMTLPLEEARAHAVVPAKAAIDMAARCRDSGQLKAVEIISTVGVGGRTPGLILERPMPEVLAFHNTYELAKAEAERVVFAHWRNLPITIHRPSMVVGESTRGRIIHFQVFYHLCEFLSGKRTSGLMPSLRGAYLDIVPADYVAGAIHWSSCNPGRERLLHLCSGPRDALPLPQLVGRIRTRAEAAGNALPQLRYLPLTAFRLAMPVLKLFAPRNIKRALGNLELFLAYLDELQTFDNTATRMLLEPAGIRVPSVGSYLDRVLDFYEAGKHRAEGYGHQESKATVSERADTV